MTRLGLAAWLLPLSVVAGTSEKVPVIPLEGRPYRTSAFKPPGGFSIFTLASDGRIVLSCQLGGDSKPGGLCMLDPATGVETLLVDGPSVGTGYADGEWLVYSDMDPPQRVMAYNLTSHEKVEVGRLAGGKSSNPIGLVYALSSPRVVWANEDKDHVNSIVLFDLKGRTSRVLKTLPPEHVVDQLSLSGDKLVWSEVDLHDERNATSTVQYHDLATGAFQTLSQGARASMPRISGRYVIWKTATRFSYGGIALHDLKTRTTRELVTVDAKARRGFDMPSISLAGATWLSAGNEQISRYLLDTKKTEVIERGGGRAAIAGHYMAWVNDSVKQKGDWHLLWCDLSAPTRPSRSGTERR
jgi:hypothetical protein